MRSILLLMLGVPIPIIILIALFSHLWRWPPLQNEWAAGSASVFSLMCRLGRMPLAHYAGAERGGRVKAITP